MARKTLHEILKGETRFGEYEVLGEGSPNPKSRMVLCRCSCGVEREVGADKLRSGRSTCCKDCAAKSLKRVTNFRHGMTRTPEYQIWSGLNARCSNPNDMHYGEYGARGITVCDRWRADFSAFFNDMGKRPSSRHSIDRLDNDGPYAPWNCRWALPSQQSANRRRTLKVEVGGIDMPTSHLAHASGMSPATMASRLKRGWTVVEATSREVQNRRPKHLVGGEMLTASEIQARFGVSRQRLNYRLRSGMSVEDAIALG
jgi:hypothetical protein